MPLVATLISNPSAPALDSDFLAAIENKLPGRGGIRILNPGVAIELSLESQNPTESGAALRELIGRRPIDLYVQSAQPRRKRLLIADMDSTMIGQECIDELADELGLKPKIAAITESAMRGEIDFEPALRERVSLLAGLDAEVVEKVIHERITLTPGARTLVQTMRANGAYCALVSGGFTAFTNKIAAMIGFHENRANELLTFEGKLTGKVAEPILGQMAKRERLEALMTERSIAREDTLAVGDGANDLAMIETAGLGVAYHAKPKVAAQADASVNHSDLTALLYLQGYNLDEFFPD